MGKFSIITTPSAREIDDGRDQRALVWRTAIQRALENWHAQAQLKWADFYANLVLSLPEDQLAILEDIGESDPKCVFVVDSFNETL